MAHMNTIAEFREFLSQQQPDRSIYQPDEDKFHRWIEAVEDNSELFVVGGTTMSDVTRRLEKLHKLFGDEIYTDIQRQFDSQAL